VGTNVIAMFIAFGSLYWVTMSRIIRGQILQLKQELYEILARHSGTDLQTIERDADRDYWLTAPEAVAYGLVDNIVTSKKKRENSK